MPDFDTLLGKVVALLRAQGRTSYLAIRERFGASDEQIEALRAELVEAQQLADDENGRVLVWRSQEKNKLQAPAEAERRELTVMFCDIVGSTQLAGELDPEELRELIQQYHNGAGAVIEQHEGHIAQYLGDGLLVYFGYPHAHEDDALRAVTAALGIIEKVSGGRIAVRIGIHTGPVVIGEVGTGTRLERLALGETPNIAARLEALASPGMALISASTRRLVEDTIAVRALGVRELRGVATPVEVFEVVRDTGVRSRFDIAAGYMVLPLIGRDRELGVLTGLWHNAVAGKGGAALVSGEPGIGKSRLAQAMKDLVAAEGYRWGLLRGSPYFRNSPLQPVVELWSQNLGWSREDTAQKRLASLRGSLETFPVDAAEALALIAPLFGLEAPAPEHTDLDRRQGVLDLLLTVIESLAGEPVLIVFEDAHWMDPSTLELLRQLILRLGTRQLALLITARPEFDPAQLRPVAFEHLELHGLSTADTEALILQVTGGRELPVALRDQIVQRGDGVPSFVEETTRMVLESGWLQRDEDDGLKPTGELPELGVPSTLRGSLTARLDRLGEARELAQLAAVLGRWFTYALLESVAPHGGDGLEAGLARLVSAGILRQRGVPPSSSYEFRYALFQEVARDSLLRRTASEYHERVATTIEERFPELARAQPEMMAQHFEAAGAAGRALGYWQWAGELAIQRSAYGEALAHLDAARKLIATLPPSEDRDQREVAIVLTLTPAVIALHGWAAAPLEELFRRAASLQVRGEERFRVLVGSCVMRLLRAETDVALELAHEIMNNARRTGQPDHYIAANAMLGGTHFYRGDLVDARTHLEEGIELYDPDEQRDAVSIYGQDPGIVCRCWLSVVCWLLGQPDRARDESDTAVRLAGNLAHPFTLAYALSWDARLAEMDGRYERALDSANRVMSRAKTHGFASLLAAARTLNGAGRARAGEAVAGAAEIAAGIDAWQDTGARAMVPYFLGVEAGARAGGGDRAGAVTLIETALGLAAASREQWWSAELLRLSAEYSGSGPVASFNRLHEALRLAERQGAAALALRVAVTLVEQEDTAATRATLSRWRTRCQPGGDTPALRRATELLAS